MLLQFAENNFDFDGITGKANHAITVLDHINATNKIKSNRGSIEL